MVPEAITLLLVGDEKCGKTTFLSRLSASQHVNPIPILRDMDQPFNFDIKLSDKEYRLHFYDTSSPESWRLLDPDVIIICFDISQRLSLINMKRYVSLSGSCPVAPTRADGETPVDRRTQKDIYSYRWAAHRRLWAEKGP
jgi:GTPase SAR1 family protein